MTTSPSRVRDPQLPDYAAELARDLRGRVDGEVRFTPGDRALYAYDASIYRQPPIGVVLPRSAEDVVAALEVCRRFDAPVFGRGCGTGLAGQTVNAAMVVVPSTCGLTRARHLVPFRIPGSGPTRSSAASMIMGAGRSVPE